MYNINIFEYFRKKMTKLTPNNGTAEKFDPLELFFLSCKGRINLDYHIQYQAWRDLNLA